MSTITTTLLEKEPLTVDLIQYDFEDYEQKYGIPETLDPLPYRKQGSVFATGEDAESVLTTHFGQARSPVAYGRLSSLVARSLHEGNGL